MKNRAGKVKKESVWRSDVSVVYTASAAAGANRGEENGMIFNYYKKCIAFAILTAAIFLTSCSNTHNSMIAETSETESEKEDCAESTDSDEETSYCADDETAAPGEDEIAAMREIVLEGVSENDAEEICGIIKTADHTIESAVIYDNFYSRLSDPDSLTWNYFDESGSIQIGWAYESDEYMQTKMSEENLTEPPLRRCPSMYYRSAKICKMQLQLPAFLLCNFLYLYYATNS